MTARKTVMICDDEEDLLHVYSAALKSSFDIITASSGKDCLKEYMNLKLAGKKIHIMLLDYRLGDMLGDDVACKIHDLNGTRVILLTAFEIDQQKTRELVRKKCIVDLVKKPVTMKSLLAKVCEEACLT